MIGLLKNNFYRAISRKYYIAIALLTTMLSIALAVCLTARVEAKASIAMVTDGNAAVFQSEHIRFHIMEKEPPKYQLVLGKYDGVIIDRGLGKYDVETIKGDEVKALLEAVVKNPGGYVPPFGEARGIGTNIMGYLMMFILIQCVLFMFVLAEDMELKQIERIAAAPVSFFKYLAAHFVFTFLMIFLPAFVILAVIKLVIGLDIGFNLLQYAALLGLLCSFGTALAMFINTLVKSADGANMIGCSLVLLTTILSGSFYSFEKSSILLEKALWVIPQKDYLGLVQGLEIGKSLWTVLPQLSYIMAVTLILLVFSVVKMKKDYVLRDN